MARQVVEGSAALKAAFAELERKVTNKLAAQAGRAGAKIIRAEAIKRAPVLSGRTKKAVKVRAGKSRKDFKSIIVAVGEKWFQGDEFYAAFIHFGFRVGSRKLGDSRKQVPANPWIDDAYEATKDQAAEAMKKVLIEGIESIRAK